MIEIPASASVLSLAPSHAAAVHVAAGQTLVIETMDCFSNTITSTDQLFSSIGFDSVNPATGPIFVTGAEPGDTLKVEIIDIRVGQVATMTMHPEHGALPGTIEERTRRLPVVDGEVVFSERLRLPASPMIGVIGTAPAEAEIPTGWPGDHGGNMDTRKIAAGTTLYLPVNVPGALLAVGDLHALQADGEVGVCGAEIAGVVRLTVDVVKGRPLPLPLLVTADQVITIASRELLDDAATEATRMMRDWLVEASDLDATDALMLLSLTGDLAISQVVDPLKTARMEVPRSVLDELGVALA